MRTTTVAVLVVGLALIVGAVAMVMTLRSSLKRDVEAAAQLRASDVVTAIEGGTDPSGLALGDGDDSFVQIVDDSGEVIAASPKLSGLRPVASLSSGSSREIEGLPTEEDDPFMVVASAAEAGGETFTVIVGRTLDPVEESGAAVSQILLFGIPLLLVVVAFTTWGVVGRALRWVESIRSQVAEISGSELHRRVPDPPGKDEIARLAETMNSMLDRLEDDQKRSRRFVSDASHELRSPVATIRNQAEVAIAHPQRTGLEELAKGVLAEDLRLEKLVDDLLVLAGNDEARTRTTLPVDLDDLVLEEAKRLRSTTTLNVASTAVSGGRTMGDASQLRRVVRNLADNAAQHATSAVAFSLRERDGWVVLLVDDDGPGIPVDQRETVFQRFTRLDDARDRDRGGAGLGLAIVKESIRRHNGTVEVVEAPLGGARFEVRLPVGR
ncbi:MAG: ATP-binding protein [Actinomycetota bacterium]